MMTTTLPVHPLGPASLRPIGPLEGSLPGSGPTRPRSVAPRCGVDPDDDEDDLGDEEDLTVSDPLSDEESNFDDFDDDFDDDFEEDGDDPDWTHPDDDDEAEPPPTKPGKK
jgi:hypothetical protein